MGGLERKFGSVFFRRGSEVMSFIFLEIVVWFLFCVLVCRKENFLGKEVVKSL